MNKNWYQKFEVNHNFYLPFSTKDDVSPFLNDNKDLCLEIQRFAWENLAELSVKLVCMYIHDILLPQMVR